MQIIMLTHLRLGGFNFFVFLPRAPRRLLARLYAVLVRTACISAIAFLTAVFFFTYTLYSQIRRWRCSVCGMSHSSSATSSAKLLLDISLVARDLNLQWRLCSDSSCCLLLQHLWVEQLALLFLGESLVFQSDSSLLCFGSPARVSLPHASVSLPF